MELFLEKFAMHAQGFTSESVDTVLCNTKERSVPRNQKPFGGGQVIRTYIYPCKVDFAKTSIHANMYVSLDASTDKPATCRHYCMVE